jgi:hypothetical protein
MRNEEVVEAIQEYHEKRIEALEEHVSALNREMGEVLSGMAGVCKMIDQNRFWLKIIGIGTPGTVFFLWFLDKCLQGLNG